MTEFLGQQLVHVDVRPKRAAVVFLTNSGTGFRSAVERSSSRWGGLNEPIVPVSPGGRMQPAWQQIIETLQPDIVFDVGGLKREAADRLSKNLGLPVLPARDENHSMYGAHPTVVELRRTSAYASSGRSACGIAAAGAVAPWDSVEGWAESGVTIDTTDDPVALATAQLGAETLIQLTATGCGEVSGSSFSAGATLLWVAEPHSLRDALWFWNMRALMSRTFTPGTAALLQPSALQEPSVRDAIVSAQGTHKWSTPDVVIASLTVEPRVLRRLAKRAGLTIVDSRQLSSHLGKERDTTAPITAAVNVDPRRFLLFERHSGVRTSTIATIESPKTVIRAESPVRFAPAGGHVRIRLSGAALQVPARQTVAALFSPNGVWKQGGLELETPPLQTYHFEIAIPSPQQVLEQAIRDAGVRAELSQPGRLAESVLHLLDVSHGLFANATVRAVIGALTTQRTKALARSLAEATDWSGGNALAVASLVGPGLAQTVRPANGVASAAAVTIGAAAEALETLARYGLVQRGLVVDCHQCGMHPFVSLAEASPEPRCPNCTSVSTFSTNDKKEVQMHYRLNGLLDRASDQGVVAHLAVRDLLALPPATSHLMLGANVFYGDQLLGEVDLLGYSGMELLCGEVKSTATDFTDQQIATTVGLAARVAADVLVAGCTEPVPDRITEKLLAATAARSIRLRVVDPTGVRMFVGEQTTLAPIP